MFAKCLNPDCQASFDYREGRVARFSTLPLDRHAPATLTRVEHYWLCGR